MKHLGSWTMFSDISGQVSRSPENPVMILAAVAVPNEVVEQVRHRLVARNPRKWKDGALNGWQHVKFLIRTYKLPTCALSIYREPGSWAVYYDGADAFRSQFAMTKGSPIAAVLNPDEALRIGLLPSPCIYLLGKIVRSRHPGTYQPATIHIDITTDSDIRSAAGRKVLGDFLAVLSKTDGFADVFGIQTTYRSQVKTEQEEPLLLMPDHIAGLFMHADRDVRLAEPVVSPAMATAAAEDLLGQCPYVYYDEAEFADVYPFRIDAGQFSRQRPSPHELDMPQGFLPRKQRRPAPAWARRLAPLSEPGVTPSSLSRPSTRRGT